MLTKLILFPQSSTLKKIEQEIKEIKQKLENGDKPDKDKPNKDKNDKPNENPKPEEEEEPEEPKPEDDSDNLNPYEREGQMSSIFKWNGCVKQGYWLFQGPKHRAGFKVNIAENHPFLKGKKLDNSDETPPFAIRFNKKDASKQEGDKTFYFDEDNTNFEIEPFGDWPDDTTEEEEPSKNNKKEVRVKFIKETFLKDYVFSDNKIELIINKNHPRIKELLKENKLQKDKEFIIRYGKIDNKFSEKRFIFEKSNKELEIIEN